MKPFQSPHLTSKRPQRQKAAPGANDESGDSHEDQRDDYEDSSSSKSGVQDVGAIRATLSEANDELGIQLEKNQEMEDTIKRLRRELQEMKKNESSNGSNSETHERAPSPTKSTSSSSSTSTATTSDFKLSDTSKLFWKLLKVGAYSS